MLHNFLSKNTSLMVCQDNSDTAELEAIAAAVMGSDGLLQQQRERSAAATVIVSHPCNLPQGFQTASTRFTVFQTLGEPFVVCPSIRLSSGGEVLSGPFFTRFHGCGCSHSFDEKLELWVDQPFSALDTASWQLQCVDISAQVRNSWHRTLVLVGILPTAALLLLSLFLR